MKPEIRELKNNYTVRIQIIQDDYAPDPREWEGADVLKVFEDKESFWAEAEKLFGKRAQEIVGELLGGEVVWINKVPWVGIEVYEHSQRWYAPCTCGNFLDRQWDVSPIVGFWSPNKENPVLKKSRGLRLKKKFEEANTLIVDACTDNLGIFTNWTNGDVHGYNLELLSPTGEVLENDDCAGFYEHKHLQEEIDSAIKHWEETQKFPLQLELPRWGTSDTGIM